MSTTGTSLICGIDLGTTNSLVGVMDAGFPVLIAGADGERLTPSVVYFPPEGEPLVGAPAARMRAIEPASTIYSIKRFMGRRAGEEPAEMPYTLGGAPGAPLRAQVRGQWQTPEEISAQVLRKLRADVEHALGQTVDRAVITVPAYFNDAQRLATKRAGELAGFTVERILSEPTAAALAYGIDRQHERARIAVYDLGGGTFDLSILELNHGVFDVRATNGHTRLGGDDIDDALAEFIAHEAGFDFHQGGGPDWLQNRARIREAAIAAKHRLSEEETVGVHLPFLGGGSGFQCEIPRTRLESLARPTLERTRAHCLRALADAGLQPGDLDEIILVGGQTRMPLVARYVGEIFGRTPNQTQNPDEAVAVGATIQAGILSGAVRDVVLLDVTPLSLGIETFGGLMNVIIPRNSTIPCKAGEMFTNAVAGQRAMEITVLQGERELAKDNWALGRFELGFEPAAKGQARVGVQFEIDADGILSVLARDIKTGHEQKVAMSSAIDVSDEAVEKMLEDSLEHAFEDMQERVLVEARQKAAEMLPAVERALALAGADLTAEERELIAARTAAVRVALEQNASAALKRATHELDEATQRLATLVIEKLQTAQRK